MEFATILTILRQILLTGATYLVTTGVIDQGLVETLVGSIIGVVTVAWGIYAKHKDQEKIKDLTK